MIEEEIKPEEIKPPDEPKPFILSIIFDPVSGDLNINGPIDNKIISIYMLEESKELIRGFHLQKRMEAKKNRIVKPNGVFMNGLRGFLKR